MIDSKSEFLDVQELSELFRLSKCSIYRLVEQRVIPFHRVSKRLRFSRADIEAYLSKQRVDSISRDYERKETA